MSNELTTQQELDILEKLKDGSGENDNIMSYNFIPYITINNSKTEEDIKGRMVKVLCEPSFNITNKDEEKKYVTTLFAKEFNATILKFKHRVQRKLLYDPLTKKSTNKYAFFRSLEFSSFKSDIYIRQDGGFIPDAISYQNAKARYGEELELWGVAYILVEGEDTVRKIEVKGASRGVLFDYMTAKKSGPTASLLTKFSVGVDNSLANPYNKLVLTEVGRVSNLVETLSKQEELNKLLEKQEKPNVDSTVTGTLMLDQKIDIDTSNIDVSKMFD